MREYLATTFILKKNTQKNLYKKCTWGEVVATGQMWGLYLSSTANIISYDFPPFFNKEVKSLLWCYYALSKAKIFEVVGDEGK